MPHYPRAILDAIPLTAVSGTITPRAEEGVLFTYSGSGAVTLAEPTGAVTGQAVVVEITASGGTLTLTLAGIAGTVAIPNGDKYRAELSYDGTGWWVADGGA